MDFEVIKESMIQNDSVISDFCIAMEGEYSYHGDPLVLSHDVFEEVISNFNGESQALPIFKGHADVNGSMTGEEVDSYGWILGLTLDEESNLWAKVQLSMELADKIKDGRFKYCSIYMRDENNRITGEEVKNRLVSLAMTNEPYLPNLPAWQLSNKKNHKHEYIYSKEINQMRQSKLSNTELAETLPAAEKSVEQADKMQEGKTVDDTLESTDTNAVIDLLTKAKPEEMALEDFVKSLLALAKGEVAEKEAEVAAAADTVEDETVTDEAEAEDEDDSAVVASTLVKKMNVALSNATKEINLLKKELRAQKEVSLSAEVDDAIAKGKLLSAERGIFIDLGSRDPKTYKELMKVRLSVSSAPVGRISIPDSRVNLPAKSDTVSALLSNAPSSSRQINFHDAVKKLLG